MTAQKLGRYEIVGELGKGAMGLVYLAKDPLIGRQLALKTFRVGLSAQDQELEQFRARFLREAQSAGILNHPNIVTIHDVVVDPTGDFFIAMEYVKGTDLKILMQSQGRLDLKFVLDIVAQIADGLDYAHSKGVVHRDIKPANIILTEDKQAKITDFGIARIDASNLTTEGQLLGTPNYMAPEQIQGKEVDHRADIFSLGVMFYELVTGKKPFQGENLTQVTHRIVFDPFPDPRRLVPGLPEALIRVMSRALEKDPASRYPSASGISQDLRAVLNPPKPTHSVIGSSGSFLGEGEESGDGHNMTMTSAAAHEALKPPTTAAIPTLQSTTGPLPTPAVVMSKPSNSLRWPLIVGALVAVLALATVMVVTLRDAPTVTGVERVDPEAELRARFQPHVDAGRRLLESGDAEGAQAEIEKALAIAPDNRSIRQLKTQAEKLAQELSGEDPEQARVAYLLGAARTAIAERDYKSAIRQAESALAIDAKSQEGKSLLSEAQEGQQRKEQVRDRLSNKPTANVPSGSASDNTTTTTAQAAPAAAETAVNIAFRAELTEGRVTVFAGPDRIMQENFKFSRGGGELEPSTFTFPAGPIKFNIYTRPKDGRTRTTEFEAELPANGQATLNIRLLDDSRVRVSLQ